jgi:SOS-response transcriptional repressor LexA
MYVVVNPREKAGTDDLSVAYINGTFVSGVVVRRDTYTIIPPNTDFRPIDLGADPEICGVMVSIAQQTLK